MSAHLLSVQFYVTSVSVIKNYVILADMFHSIHLLYWRAVDFSLSLVSKDYDNRVYLSTSFIIDGNKLGIISGDDEGNIQILQENTKYSDSSASHTYTTTSFKYLSSIPVHHIGKWKVSKDRGCFACRIFTWVATCLFLSRMIYYLRTPPRR